MHARRLNAVASHLQVSTQHVASEEEYKAALVACRAKLAAFIDKMNANRDAMRCDPPVCVVAPPRAAVLPHARQALHMWRGAAAVHRLVAATACGRVLRGNGWLAFRWRRPYCTRYVFLREMAIAECLRGAERRPFHFLCPLVGYVLGTIYCVRVRWY